VDSQRRERQSISRDGQTGLWIWERNSGRLRKLVERGLSNAAGVPRWLPRWIDDHRLLYAMAPAESPPTQLAAGFKGAIDEAKRYWARGLAGHEASVSVLETGVSQARPKESLAVIDVV